MTRTTPLAKLRVPLGGQEIELQAEVLWVDRYGNAQLNLDPDEIVDFGERVRIRFGDTVRSAHVVATYDEALPLVKDSRAG